MTKRRRLTVSTVTSLFLGAKSCTVMKIWKLFVANSMKFWKKMDRNYKFCKILSLKISSFLYIVQDWFK
jgi:hypothetical protein